MYKLYLTQTFQRRVKVFLKRHPELESALIDKLDLAIRNPFAPALKTHKLSGKLRSHWAICLTYEYRILFIIENDDIYLTNICSHDEIY
ncbi:MAG: plasmid stabilization protein [Planctomycetota bacterium]|nr:plasmid stabilization protein [Planctomycetota bacterium]